MSIRPEDCYVEIFTIVRRFFPKARVYLFGSRSRKKGRAGSDIDIAIDNSSPVDFFQLLRLKSKLEETNIPYKIDVVDVQTVQDPLHTEIITKGELWKF